MLIFHLVLVGAGECAESKIFPLTRAEMTEIVHSWLKDSGFTVSSAQQGMEYIEIRAVRDGEEWRIRLRHHSALATQIEAAHSVDGSQAGNHEQSLWNFLSGYVNGSDAEVNASNTSIPTRVLANVENVVCIDAKATHEDLQFSGCVVDETGLILSTAHNLLDIEEIRIKLFDGTMLPGQIVKIDYERDLALINVDMMFPTHVSLSSGVQLVGMGEVLYSVGCPENLGGTIYSGFINGPPRSVDQYPLWQASIKVYPGSSGSPVFDRHGNLVAVVKARHRGTDSMGFLIPMETIIAFIQDTRNTPTQE
ncbi:MAG: S1 family peptidase [Desulfomonilia bacterium]